MGTLRLVILFGWAVLASGCMISEQAGQIPQELAFHFDTDFNRAIVFGRVIALVLLVMWIFAKFKKPNSILLSLPLLVLAGWTLAKDFPSLVDYRVEVRDDALYLNIPPEPGKVIPWNTVEEMEIEGTGWASAGSGPTTTITPFGVRKTEYAWSELPEWQTMELTADGETHLIVLAKLSVEQRQTLWRAIAKRARLRKAD
jgi:hypothetical protein